MIIFVSFFLYIFIFLQYCKTQHHWRCLSEKKNIYFLYTCRNLNLNFNYLIPFLISIKLKAKKKLISFFFLFWTKFGKSKLNKIGEISLKEGGGWISLIFGKFLFNSKNYFKNNFLNFSNLRQVEQIFPLHFFRLFPAISIDNFGRDDLF